MSALGIPKLRDWEWIPHLLSCYLFLGLLWFIAGSALYVLFGGDTQEAVLGTNTMATGVTLPFGAYLLGLPVVVIPVFLAVATIRVIINEQRWRREADPRGK